MRSNKIRKFDFPISYNRNSILNAWNSVFLDHLHWLKHIERGGHSKDWEYGEKEVAQAYISGLKEWLHLSPRYRIFYDVTPEETLLRPDIAIKPSGKHFFFAMEIKVRKNRKNIRKAFFEKDKRNSRSDFTKLQYFSRSHLVNTGCVVAFAYLYTGDDESTEVEYPILNKDYVKLKKYILSFNGKRYAEFFGKGSNPQNWGYFSSWNKCPKCSKILRFSLDGMINCPWCDWTL